MNMVQKHNLVNAINQVIFRLNTKPKCYHYMNCYKCNVGLLVQELLGITEIELENTLHHYSGIWCTMFEKNQDDRENLLKKISATGLTQKHLEELEGLSNPKICKIANLQVRHNGYASVIENLITYLAVWAKLIEKEFQLKAKLVTEKQIVNELSKTTSV